MWNMILSNMFFSVLGVGVGDMAVICVAVSVGSGKFTFKYQK